MDDVMKAVCACSYNQLVEKIINLKSSLDPDKVTDGKYIIIWENLYRYWWNYTK